MKTSGTFQINFFETGDSLEYKDPLNFQLTLINDNSLILSNFSDYTRLFFILADWLKIYKNPEDLALSEKNYYSFLSSKKKID